MAKKLVVIGGGPGGYAAALAAARRNWSVTLVEKTALGGSCLHVGCIPSKFLLSAAKRSADSRALPHRGIDLDVGTVRMARLWSAKTALLRTLSQRMEQAVKSSGVERLVGGARFQSPRQVEVNDASAKTRTVEFDHAIIATGSRPAMPSHLPQKHPTLYTSDTIFDIDFLPAHLVVIGGGYIGCELACAFQGLGSKVTLVEQEARLLPAQPDFEAAGPLLQRAFESRGMTVWLRARLEKAEPLEERKWRLSFSNDDVLEANAVLVAVGRAPHWDSLDLEKAGVRVQDHRIAVGEDLQTSAPGIYAVGDVASPLPLAHVAAMEGEIAVARIAGEPRVMDYHMAPKVVFTWPEAAAVGLSEPEARSQGYGVRIHRYHLAANGKAMADGETEGLWAVLSDADSDRILGGLVVGPHATELIHLISLCLRGHLTVKELQETIFAHPTLAEGLREALLRPNRTPSPSPLTPTGGEE